MKKWIVLLSAACFTQVLWASEMPATLQWSQRVELSTPVSGVMQAVNVEVGDLVKKGQILLVLDNTSYQARVTEYQSAVTRLNAEAEEAKQDFDRVQELHERTVVATAELDQARLRMVTRVSLLAEAQARLRQEQKVLEDTYLRAPFDAVVILRQAEPGMSVAIGLQPQMLLTLARSGQMIARMQLTPQQMSNLKHGQTVTVKVAGTSYSGKIKALGLEPVNKKEELVYAVDAVFDSKLALRAGSPAIVELP